MPEICKTAAFVPCLVFAICYNSRRKEPKEGPKETEGTPKNIILYGLISETFEMVGKETLPDGNGKNAEDTDLSG